MLRLLAVFLVTWAATVSDVSAATYSWKKGEDVVDALARWVVQDGATASKVQKVGFPDRRVIQFPEDGSFEATNACEAQLIMMDGLDADTQRLLDKHGRRPLVANVDIPCTRALTSRPKTAGQAVEPPDVVAIKGRIVAADALCDYNALQAGKDSLARIHPEPGTTTTVVECWDGRRFRIIDENGQPFLLDLAKVPSAADIAVTAFPDRIELRAAISRDACVAAITTPQSDVISLLKQAANAYGAAEKDTVIVFKPKDGTEYPLPMSDPYLGALGCTVAPTPFLFIARKNPAAGTAEPAKP